LIKKIELQIASIQVFENWIVATLFYFLCLVKTPSNFGHQLGSASRERTRFPENKKIKKLERIY
jgi:hypothetical protein